MKKTLLALSAASLFATSPMLMAETIDIAFLYTNAAAAKTSNINTKINQYISFANQVYQQNGLNITLRLAGSTNLGNYSISPSEGWLNSITDSSWVQGIRNNQRADMVVTLGVGASAGSNLISCGIAWVGQGNNGTFYPDTANKMYSITAVDCGATTFVHELGHNQGLTHSRKQGDTRGGVYTDGMGYGVDNVFASIMAYPHVFGSATQYDYFSNPNWKLGNYTYGVVGQAYAHKTVDATKDDIARMR